MSGAPRPELKRELGCDTGLANWLLCAYGDGLIPLAPESLGGLYATGAPGGANPVTRAPSVVTGAPGGANPVTRAPSVVTGAPGGANPVTRAPSVVGLRRAASSASTALHVGCRLSWKALGSQQDCRCAGTEQEASTATAAKPAEHRRLGQCRSAQEPRATHGRYMVCDCRYVCASASPR